MSKGPDREIPSPPPPGPFPYPLDTILLVRSNPLPSDIFETFRESKNVDLKIWVVKPISEALREIFT